MRTKEIPLFGVNHTFYHSLDVYHAFDQHPPYEGYQQLLDTLYEGVEKLTEEDGVYISTPLYESLSNTYKHKPILDNNEGPMTIPVLAENLKLDMNRLIFILHQMEVVDKVDTGHYAIKEEYDVDGALSENAWRRVVKLLEMKLQGTV